MHEYGPSCCNAMQDFHTILLQTMLCAVCREQYAIPVLVKLLEAMPFDGVTAAAADALRALALNNEGNKTAIREAWAVPLLVKLLGSEVKTT